MTHHPVIEPVSGQSRERNFAMERQARKAAVIQLTKSTARELGENNVRVNCICPGGIATPNLW